MSYFIIFVINTPENPLGGGYLLVFFTWFYHPDHQICNLTVMSLPIVFPLPKKWGGKSSIFNFEYSIPRHVIVIRPFGGEATSAR